jgi:hypothetical protein
MMTISFKGAHFPQEIILMGVRWYLASCQTLLNEGDPPPRRAGEDHHRRECGHQEL